MTSAWFGVHILVQRVALFMGVANPGVLGGNSNQYNKTVTVAWEHGIARSRTDERRGMMWGVCRPP